MTLLLNTRDTDRIDAFRATFARDLPDVTLVTPQEAFDPAQVRYVFTWLPLPDWSIFPALEIVFSVSAGVDQFATLPPDLALIKMSDPNNTRMVVEYVLSGCLACLRDLPSYAWAQRHQDWNAAPVRCAADTHVAVLGLGEIGCLAAEALRDIGFQVSGWSRSQKHLPGVTCITGIEARDHLLSQADIVVCLLPLTPETRRILNRETFVKMKPGASLVHAGRGAHCDFGALAEALERGHLRNAVIDVFDTEPLPEGDAVWALPRTFLTPHIAGRTDAQTGAQNVATNIARHKGGLDLLWQVDRRKGY
ncbi:MAG: glyoxylate/hydroxypyruvate reductase A [Alphaproteobacteria bacterium]|nr:glyoxylate/hydroxypyruvate reductase A [Alphaproteobacteria bacterium]MBU1281096.1 glyoxylate/hydroxypyruvate reductase A [Alphaproteobacteria bacterium]MBU1571767.1 glyoxylate/hydroxypyruvate reductase A [Alphaproteobacteria bacterium]MBU1828689.1 glyoxylate/hydroxypyruvate reductase A [Alphaproteobacteria bacterium]MBU2078504.1 glyoxylate/hydroxypyruvate reductase A [Alphaproteobacteria bacterium]